MHASPPLGWNLSCSQKKYDMSSTGSWNGHGLECSRPMRPTAQLHPGSSIIFNPNCRPKGDIHCPPCVIHVQSFTHVGNGSLGNIHHAMTPFPCHVFLPTIRVGRSAKISLWHPLTCWAHPAQCCPQVSLRSSRAIPAWAMPIAPRHPFPTSKGGRPKFGLETLETTKQIPDPSWCFGTSSAGWAPVSGTPHFFFN